MPIGNTAPQPTWPHQYHTLQAYCTDPHGVNATCSGAVPTIANRTTPMETSPEEYGSQTVDACWNYCSCEAEINVTQSGSTEDTGNNVAEMVREQHSSTSSKSSSSAAAQHGQHGQHAQTSSGSSTVTNRLTAASATKTTMMTTTSRASQ